MVPNNADIDPFSPETNYFECQNCQTRTTSENRLTSCGACGGRLTNIAVPRE